MGRSAAFRKIKARRYGRGLTKNQKTAVKRIVGSTQEKKQKRVAASAVSVGPTPTVTHLTGIAQGDGDTDRSGDELTLKKLEFRAVVTGTDSPNNRCRVLLIQYYPARSATTGATGGPNAADIIEDFSGDGTTQLNYIRPHRDDTKGTYKVLMDRQFTVTPSTEALKYQKFVKAIRWKFGRKKVRYHAGSSVTGEAQLYLMHFSDSAVASHPSITWESRVTYTDS